MPDLRSRYIVVHTKKQDTLEDINSSGAARRSSYAGMFPRSAMKSFIEDHDADLPEFFRNCQTLER